MSRVVAIPCLYYVESDAGVDAEVDAELLRAAWDAEDEVTPGVPVRHVELDPAKLKPDMSRGIYSIDTFKPDHHSELYEVRFELHPRPSLPLYDQALLEDAGTFEGTHATDVLARNRYEAVQIGVRHVLARLLHADLHDAVGVVLISAERK
jgi:hypothetical protein